MTIDERSAIKANAFGLMLLVKNENMEMAKTCYDEIVEILEKDRDGMRGEWKKVENGKCICPFCGEEKKGKNNTYCSGCGAKLEGDS